MVAKSVRKTTSLNDFYSSETEYVMPAIQRTEKIMAVDKTAQFISTMSMIIRHNFAVVTIRLDDGYDYRVIFLKRRDNHLIRVYFHDFGGKNWYLDVSEFNKFSIFRGV